MMAGQASVDRLGPMALFRGTCLRRMNTF